LSYVTDHLATGILSGVALLAVVVGLKVVPWVSESY